jgi:hypothetical protein
MNFYKKSANPSGMMPVAMRPVSGEFGGSREAVACVAVAQWQWLSGSHTPHFFLKNIP